MVVQDVEGSLAQLLTRFFSAFSTTFCTGVLKTSSSDMSLPCFASKNKKPPSRGGFPDQNKFTQPFLLITFHRYRSWNARSARHPDLRALPSSGSWYSPRSLPA